MLVGDGDSVFVEEASKFPRLEPNCIYYTDDYWEGYLTIAFERGRRGEKDMGIYSLEDGAITPCYEGESFSRICPPIWVTPSL